MRLHQYELYKNACDLKFNKHVEFNKNMFIYKAEKAEFYEQKAKNNRRQNLIKKIKKVMSQWGRKRKRKRMRAHLRAKFLKLKKSYLTVIYKKSNQRRSPPFHD